MTLFLVSIHMRFFHISLRFLGLLILTHTPVSAGILDFVDIRAGSLQDKFSNIHFAAGGNDFGGGIFWLPTKSLSTGESINGQFMCTKKLAGMYYNAQRGARLWPLDESTLTFFQQLDPNYSQLAMTGGLYTTCSGGVYDIYGQIQYTLGSQVSRLTAGTQYDFATNSIDLPFDLAPTLQYFDNKTPIGFLFDTHGGGIGFIGGYAGSGAYQSLSDDLNTTGSINTYIQYSGGGLVVVTTDGTYPVTENSLLGGLDTLWNIGIKGAVGLSLSLLTDERRSIQGNIGPQSSVFNAPTSTIAQLLNQVSKSAGESCRGLTIIPFREQGNQKTDLIENVLGSQINKSLACIQGENTDVDRKKIVIDLSDPTQYQGKTFIIKQADVILINSMVANESAYLDLYVDGGNVFFANTPTNLQNFTAQGFPTAVAGVSRGVYVRGNIFVNGVLGGYDLSTNEIAPYAHKLYIHGKMSSLANPLQPAQGRINQVIDVLGVYDENGNSSDCPNINASSQARASRKDCQQATLVLKNINLQEAFSWSCNTNFGTGTDGTPCSDATDEFALNALIVINTDLPSKLFK